MKITLTIEVDNNGSVTVQPNTVAKDNQVPVDMNVTNLGEKLPRGWHAADARPRTEEYPFNVADAKLEMDRKNVSIPELAREIGNFPVPKLRNIFRYDTRRFTKEEYNVILKAIDEVVKSKEINI